MIDKQKIENLFSELDKYLKELKALSLLSEEEYFDNKRNIYSGRYLLQISVETCINIGNHILSRKSLGIPKDYADTFTIMESNNIISESLLGKLILMARFRNRLVHLYWDIDDKLVLEFMRKDYDDFIEFRNSVLNFINENLKDNNEN